MRNIPRLLLVVVAVTLLAAASHAAAKPEDGIRAVADAYVKASLAGDVKAIVALYTADATEMPPNHPAVKGHDALTAYYQQQMAAAKLNSFTIEHLDVQAVGDHGYDVGTYKQSVTMNGKTMYLPVSSPGGKGRAGRSPTWSTTATSRRPRHRRTEATATLNRRGCCRRAGAAVTPRWRLPASPAAPDASRPSPLPR